MRIITQEELSIVLEKHGKWLRGKPGGERANLCGADLRGADLRGADLGDANLCGADLYGASLRCASLCSANLCGADLRGASLRCADLYGADLYGASLRCANLRGADLRGADLGDADLRGADLGDANLRGADLDYASWPLWCGSLHAQIDDRQAKQLLYHVLSAVSYSDNCSDDLKAVLLTEDNIAVANQFHRVDKCGKLTVYEGGEHHGNDHD